MQPLTKAVTFVPWQSVSPVEYQVAFSQPGNNYIVAAGHNSSVLERFKFREDGVTLYAIDSGGNAKDVSDDVQTEILTIWRTLWVEDAFMLPPSPGNVDGFFTGEPGCNACDDDRDSLVVAPPVSLIRTTLESALVHVDLLPTTYNHRREHGFIHNWAPQQVYAVENALRDVASESAFWVVHNVGAYEQAPGQDFDGENNWQLGWSYVQNGDKANAVFHETIRDVLATMDHGENDPQEYTRSLTVLSSMKHCTVSLGGMEKTAQMMALWTGRRCSTAAILQTC